MSQLDVALQQVKIRLLQSDPEHPDYEHSQYALSLAEYLGEKKNEYALVFLEWICLNIKPTVHFSAAVLAFAYYVMDNAFNPIFAGLGTTYRTKIIALRDHIAQTHSDAKLKDERQRRSESWSEQYEIDYDFRGFAEVYLHRRSGTVILTHILSTKLTLEALLRWRFNLTFRDIYTPPTRHERMYIMHALHRIPLDEIGKIFGVTTERARLSILKIRRVLYSFTSAHLAVLKTRWHKF